MRCIAPILVFLLLGASASAEDAQYVRVPLGAEFRTAPGAGEVVSFVRDVGGETLAVYRYHGTKDGWAALETEDLPSQNPHCAYGPDELHGLRLKLYVRESSLARVLVQALETEYAPGLKVWVQPGWPVLDADGRLGLAGDAARFGVAPDPALVGRSYAVGEMPPKDHKGTWCPTQGTVTSSVLFHDCESWDRVTSYDTDADQEGRFTASVTDGCLRWQVRAKRSIREAALLGVLGTSEGGLLGVMEVETKTIRVTMARAGATLYWQDGTIAGAVSTEHRIDGTLPGRAGRRCFAQVTACGPPAGKIIQEGFHRCDDPEEHPSITLCVNPGDLIEGEIEEWVH